MPAREQSHIAGIFANRWVHVCLIIMAGALTYANSLSGPLVFDDQSAIRFNPQIRELWPLSKPLTPPQNTAITGRPLVNLSFAINYAIGGLDVRGYHVGNISLHILSALVLLGVIRLTLTGPKLRRRYASVSDGLALACALIWMLHPLQTEPVDYLTQRTELMMGLFYLLTLYCAIRATRSQVPDRWHAASILCCALGMGCKESMVTAPVMVMIYDCIFVFESAKEALRARKVLYSGLVATWVELAALMTSSRHSTIGFAAGTPVWTYLLNQANLVVRYLILTVWPRSLVLDYGVPQPLTLADVLPSAVLVVGLLLGTAVTLALRPMVGFLGAWFFVTLAPTSSIVPIASEVGAERRMYLPLAALVVLAIISGRLLLERMSRSARARGWPLPARYEPTVATVAVMMVAAALAWGTARRNADYASPVSLLRTVVERWPHGRAHLNLGVALKMQGDRDEALEHIRQAVPDNPQAQYVLGSELYDRGRFDEAIVELREFLRRDPLRLDMLAAHNVIGLSLASQGKLAEAAGAFRSALTMEPRSADLHGNLAFVLLAQNDFEGASLHYVESLKYRPGNVFALTNLGIALAAMGQRDNAIEQFRRALASDPNNAEARKHLAGAQGIKDPSNGLLDKNSPAHSRSRP